MLSFPPWMAVMSSFCPKTRSVAEVTCHFSRIISYFPQSAAYYSLGIIESSEEQNRQMGRVDKVG